MFKYSSWFKIVPISLFLLLSFLIYLTFTYFDVMYVVLSPMISFMFCLFFFEHRSKKPFFKDRHHSFTFLNQNNYYRLINYFYTNRLMKKYNTKIGLGFASFSNELKMIQIDSDITFLIHNHESSDTIKLLPIGTLSHMATNPKQKGNFSLELPKNTTLDVMVQEITLRLNPASGVLNTLKQQI